MMKNGSYKLRAAATLRGILNDLKRNEEVAAHELGIAPDILRRALSGNEPLPYSVVEKAAGIWPVNERDFLPLLDDAPDGVHIMRAADSARTSRIIKRAGVEYYEYRDTAMSRVSSIRPEWIKILNVVADNNPHNKTVQWNNGHFLYQFTYFIGEVNYYYEWNGQRYCEPMNTGDSVFGMPYAPHSFSSRNADRPGLILALTYGGRLSGDAQHELSILPVDAVGKMAYVNAASKAAIVKRFLADFSCSEEALTQRAGLPKGRLAALLSGAERGRSDEWQKVAKALRVPWREFDVKPVRLERGVKIVKGAGADHWALPSQEDASYEVKDLASGEVTPFSRGIELTILKSEEANDIATLETSLHQYGYVTGDRPLEVIWEANGMSRQETLYPNDSFYIKPFVAHKFAMATLAGRTAPAPKSQARVLLLRTAGKISGDTFHEISSIGPASLQRYATETALWYEPAGRN